MKRLALVAVTAVLIIAVTPKPARAVGTAGAQPGPPLPRAGAALSGPSKFHPVTPRRILDTRSGVGVAAGKPGAGAVVTFRATGAGGVPATGVSAVVLNVTITEASGVGFVQVFPTGRATVGASSNLNVEHVGQTIPNLVVVPVGSGGQVSIYTQSGGHLLADVFGWFGPSPATRDGRYVALPAPKRVLDTRDPDQVPVEIPANAAKTCSDFGGSWITANFWFWTFHHWGDINHLDADHDNIPCESLPGAPSAPMVPPDLFKLPDFGEIDLNLVAGVSGFPTILGLEGGPTTGSWGIPAGATAIVANVTATQPQGPGFVEVAPKGAPLGLSSNLNVEAVGQSISNLVVVPLSADGSITLFTQTATHLIVDVLGYFTGPSAAVSTDGLFVPVSPARLLDTRDPAKTSVLGPLPPGGIVTVAPLGHGGLPASGVGSLFLNTTITQSIQAGYAQVYPTGSATPGSSSTVNVDGPGATHPNATFATLSPSGRFSIFDYAGGHLLADSAGWFTRAPPTPSGVLAGLVIAPASSPVPYVRSSWGDWIDANGDCQNTRAEVLVAQAIANTVTLSPNHCSVTGGQWHDPYTNQIVVGPSNVDIDHMVPLGNAHVSGAWAWDATTKRAYYNDLADTDHLLAVRDSVNQAKGDKGPEAWKPPYTGDWCRYATDWATIKKKWSLTVTQSEYNALASMLTTC
jgi:hypothetical protein